MDFIFFDLIWECHTVTPLHFYCYCHVVTIFWRNSVTFFSVTAGHNTVGMMWNISSNKLYIYLIPLSCRNSHKNKGQVVTVWHYSGATVWHSTVKISFFKGLYDVKCPSFILKINQIIFIIHNSNWRPEQAKLFFTLRCDIHEI